MNARMSPFTLLLVVVSLMLLVLSCDDSDDINPVSAAVDHYGYVEGIITLEGKSLDSVNIQINNFNTFSSSLKKAAQHSDTNKFSGYYKITLIEGTYGLTFYKYIPGRTLKMDKFISITAGKSIKLDINFNEVYDTLKFISTGQKIVSISWPAFASYYQVYRSIDSIHWTFVPGSQVLSTGKKNLYTSTSPQTTDSVPSLGSYFYKVYGYSTVDSLTFQTSAKKYSFVNIPPAIKSVVLADSISFLYGNILLNTGYTDYSGYSVIILKSDIRSMKFSNYDTIAGSTLVNNIQSPMLYYFRDSTCDTGYYAFRFYVVDKTTGKTGDTTNTYSISYKKSGVIPTLTLYDYMQYVQISINRNINTTTQTIFEILRAKDDTTKAIPIDTVLLAGNSYTFTYQDYYAEADTLYYAVRQLCGTDSCFTKSNFYGIVHVTTPPPPSLYSPIDSGTYVRLQYSTSITGFPIVVFRASSKDTVPIAIDTLNTTQIATLIYRDYPPKADLYSYAMAHLGKQHELGKISAFATIYFKNAPVTPGVTATQVNGTTANVRISNINNISGVVIRRSETLSGTIQKTDTIYTSEFNNFEMTASYPQSLIYLDTFKTQGTYTYTVNTFNINGTLSKDGIAALHISAQLPSPASPVVSTSDLYNTITTPSTVTSTTADSVCIYRAKDSMTTFSLLRTLPVAWSTTFIDSVYKYGSGRYYYKIKIIKGKLTSDFSAPVEIYYSGLLSAPGYVKLGADSTTVRIVIPSSNVSFDSLTLFRTTAGSSEYVPIAKIDSTAAKGYTVIDSVKTAGIYTYKTRYYYKTLSSRFSSEKSINVPGIGYRIFSTPLVNDTLKIGAIYQIKYNSGLSDGSMITIYLYKGTTSIQTVSSATAYSVNGSYNWTVPSSITPGNGYHLEAFDYYSDELLDRSEEFVIAAAQ